MTNVTKHIFKMPDGQGITSLVMDEDSFNTFVDRLEGIRMANRGNIRADEIDIGTIRSAKHLSLMARGAKTQHLFELYEVETDLVSAIVRGHGNALADTVGPIQMAFAWIAVENFDELKPLMSDFPEDATYDVWLDNAIHGLKKLGAPSAMGVCVLMRPKPLAEWMAKKGLTKVGSAQRAEFAGTLAAEGRAEFFVPPIVQGEKSDVVHVRSDFAEKLQTVIFEALSPSIQADINRTADAVVDKIRAGQGIDIEIRFFCKRHGREVAVGFQEALARSDVEAIGQTLTVFAQIGLSPERFRNYLGRLFASNVLTFDIYRADRAPDYLRIPEMAAKLAPALRLINTTHAEWIECLDRSGRRGL